MTSQTVRRIPIHRSLNRPTLVLGGDRELVMGAALLAGVLIFSISTWWGVALGLLLWATAITLLSRMAKADPLLRQVFLRHQRYQTYFAASARWCGRSRVVAPGWGRK